MKTKNILNRELASAVASMGHTDRMVIADAAYPIPEDANRIDLALRKNVPTIYDVLETINSELVVEQVQYSEGAVENNPQHPERIHDIYEGHGAALESIPQDEIMDLRTDVKYIVRTGHFMPWGNVVLQSGTDPSDWFDQSGVTMPPEQEERYRDIHGTLPE